VRSGGASRTAVFVCQGRAVADGRFAVGEFADPQAARLLTPAELEPVELARAGHLPPDGAARLRVQAVEACAEVVTPRTVVNDAAVTEALDRAPDAQVVLLGAGLDARPWRLPALAGAVVLAVDHPASQADARRRTAALPPPGCDLRYVPVDLTVQPLRPALLAAGHDPARPTVWIWEGVIPYLTAAAVTATVDALTAASGPGSRLIANYQIPSLVAALGRRVMVLLASRAGVETVTADEPWRSAWTPARIGRLLRGRGWTVESDESLLDTARRIGSPTRHSRSLSNGHVLVAGR